MLKNMSVLLVVLTTIITLANGATIPEQSGGCELLVYTDSLLMPFIIFKDDNRTHEKHAVSATGSSSLSLASNESVYLSCAPFKLQKFDNVQFVEATCKTGQTLVIDGVDVQFNDLQCEESVNVQREHPVNGCTTNTKHTSIKSAQNGFYDPIKNISYVIAEICYDTTENNIIFQRNKLSLENFNIVPLFIKDGQYFEPLQPVPRDIAKDMLTVMNKALLLKNNPNSANQVKTIKTAIAFTGTIHNNSMFNVSRRLTSIPAGVFLSKNTYEIEDSLDMYIGSFGEGLEEPKKSASKYFWVTVLKNQDALSVVLPTDYSNVEIKELCENGDLSNEKLLCRYDDMQKKIWGMPNVE